MSANAPEETIQQERISKASGSIEHSVGGPSWLHFHTVAFAVGFAALLALIIFTVLSFLKTHDNNVVEISGRIEAPETHISAIAATRVKAVRVHEGDKVNKGQLLIELDTGVVNAKVGNVQQAIAQASRATRQADLHAAAMANQVAEARKKSNGFWTKVFTSPKGRAKQGERLRGDMLQAKMMQMQARTALARAKAMSSAASAAKTNFNITSPISGYCETRSIEPGELVATGQVMLTIIDPQRVYMKGYIAEGDIGKIKLGQKADVYLDSDSKRALPAHITAIDSTPSFTPENVYFKDDRVRQVFGIKLDLDHPEGIAKPGMSADAKIRLKGREE